MTNDDAYAIQADLAELEFPFMYKTALQFSLFRTYGIPTISKLLVATKELSESTTAAKRYTDTAVLIAEFMANTPTSERSVAAIARMNHIHSVYQKAGKIGNDDMLYTLALFALEPTKWIQRYEWRKLNDMETCAIGTFWKGIGDAMKIDYAVLARANEGWADGLDWLGDIDAWRELYEREHMVPDLYNKRTADETTAILLWHVPEQLKRVGRQAVSALMDDRLRKAMIYDEPSPLINAIINGPYSIFQLRKFLLRHLTLPRLFRYHTVSPNPTAMGNLYLLDYDALPFYIQPTLLNRWGPGAWIVWLLGNPLPGDGGEKYQPKGYRINECGPLSMRGKGLVSMDEIKARLRTERTGGCPFAFG
ncbi:MAG: hypothetical protein M1827_003235 [Pycnora praestabilis]|nr:MAG: hypothetical protein M1827_003235 [Pycnora praestabilis]